MPLAVMNPKSTNCGTVLAIDVGNGTIKAELLDEQDVVRARLDIETPHNGDAVHAIQAAGEELLTLADSPVTNAGVVVPGRIDRHRGIACYSARLGWNDLPLASLLEESWHVPVRIANDVASAGVAEQALGAARGESHCAVIVIGTGIAAAIISGGRLLAGPQGETSEIGHLPIAAAGECACGSYGCLEIIASAEALARHYSELRGVQVTSAQTVLDLLGSDEIADRLWARTVDALGAAIGLLTTVVAVRRVVLGGGLSAAGDLLTKPLRDSVARQGCVASTPEIITSQLGTRAGVIGASLLARNAWPD